MSTRRETAPTIALARRRLRALSNRDDAAFLQRFFKTRAGEYGAGDRFLGIRVPTTRRLAREFRALPLVDVVALLHEPWHEARLLALMLLVARFERGTAAERREVYRVYLANTARINNWDLVDASASNIVGAYLEGRSRAPLDRLARSQSLWERRVAIIATFWYIRRGDYDDTLRIVERLLGDGEDLLHKACGWMLREVGKRDRVVLESFLSRHARAMPRTMLRYAIEKMTPEDRQHWMHR